MSENDKSGIFQPRQGWKDQDDLEKERIDRENEAYMRKQAERKGIDVTKSSETTDRFISQRRPAKKPAVKAPLPTDHDLREGYPKDGEYKAVPVEIDKKNYAPERPTDVPHFRTAADIMDDLMKLQVDFVNLMFELKDATSAPALTRDHLLKLLAERLQ